MNSQPTDILPSSLHSSFPASEALSLLLNNLEESFLLVDRQLRIVLINNFTRKKFKSFLGADISIGMPILDLAPESRCAGLRSIYEDVLRGAERKSEISFMADGQLRWFEN